jgi:hypothetical protein
MARSMTRCLVVFRVLAIAVLASFAARRMSGMQATAKVPDKEAIPKNFKTWSLFLVCNPKWLDPATNGIPTGLNDLYRQFENFGRTIGDDNVAVWFWKPSGKAGAPEARDVDVERSVRFCQAWKLKPSASPHVVVTSTYPDETHLSGLERVVTRAERVQ